MQRIPIKERLFESIENVLWVFDKALSEADLSVNYYRKEKSKGNKRLSFIDHPEDNRYSLVAFETLSDQHKEKIVARFKNPYDFVVREPILRLVTNDIEVNKFFLDYRFNDNKTLPLTRVKQYTRAACWLNMLKEVENSGNKIVKGLGIKMPEFYDHLEALMNIEKANGSSDTYTGTNQLPAKFPTSYRNLRPKLKEYLTVGPSCLIDKMYGNQLAAKINDEVSEAQLLTLIEDPHQYDDVMVAFLYNHWANSNNYALISPATVGIWRRKKEQLIIMGREGNEALNEKYLRQVKGFRPTVPLYLVEHDDNNLDFLFSDTTGYAYNKYVAITVKDSFCDLLLGKSYLVGKSPEQEQLHHAYIDAMYYIRHLTGGWYMPFELKSDKWAQKAHRPFYEKIGRFIPPAHGNKHRGYIEQSFGSPLWKRAQQLVSKGNWSGNNISAKYFGVNREQLDRNDKNRPLIGSAAEEQIEQFFYLLRHMPDFKRTEMDAPSKEQKWLQAWNELSIEQKRPITDEQFLLTFGITHKPKHTTGIKITNRGIEPQIKNRKLSYDMPESWMYEKYIGARVEVIYDPFDLSRVLITNNDDIRFIAKTAVLTPRALKDYHTDCRTYLNAILEEKGEQVERISKAAEKRKAIADRSYYNAEAMLQGGAILPKEIKNEVEQLYIEDNVNMATTNNNDVYDPLDDM